MNVLSAPDGRRLAMLAAQHLAELVHQHPAALRFRLALSGGQTPLLLYQTLARDYANSLDWTRIDFFWSDERLVSPEDPQSNYRLAQEHLLEPLHITQGQIFRVHTETGNAQHAADHYEDTILRVLGKIPSFDCVLLGLGDDGHTASLFPNSEALEKTDRWVAANWISRLQSWRVTFTFPLLNQARHIFFLVSGENKAEILELIFSGAPYPAARVKPIKGQVQWFVDRPAGARLRQE